MLKFLIFFMSLQFCIAVTACKSNNCTEKVIPKSVEKQEISCSEGQYIDVHEKFIVCKCQPFSL